MAQTETESTTTERTTRHGWVVVCRPTNQTSQPFDTQREALQWSMWSHYCYHTHTYRRVEIEA